MLRMLTLLLLVGLIVPIPAYAASEPTSAPLAVAQEESELAEWRWPALGISFQYPASWSSVNEQGFDFLLVENIEDANNTGFTGAQSGELETGSTVEDTFLQLVTQYGGEAEELDLNGVAAYSLEFTPGTGRTVRLVGFESAGGVMALLIFSSLEENWETYSQSAEMIVDSLTITPLELDVAALDSNVTENFEADQVIRVGAADAPVKLVEVMDFSCPHCARYESSIQRLIQDYVVAGQLQIEFRFATFVGNDLSVTATQAQYCAASLGFGWQMHEKLFDIQLQEGANMFLPDNINSVVRTIEGADAAAFETCLAESPYGDLIERDAQFIEDYEVGGTPTMLFGQGDGELGYMLAGNGDELRGAIPVVEIYTYLDDLLSEE